MYRISGVNSGARAEPSVTWPTDRGNVANEQGESSENIGYTKFPASPSLPLQPVGAPFSPTSFFNRSGRQQQRQALAAATAAASHHQRSPSAEHSLSRSSPAPHVRTPSGGSHVAAPVSPALTPVTTGRSRRHRPSISYSGSHSIAMETPNTTGTLLFLHASCYCAYLLA